MEKKEGKLHGCCAGVEEVNPDGFYLLGWGGSKVVRWIWEKSDAIEGGAHIYRVIVSWFLFWSSLFYFETISHRKVQRTIFSPWIVRVSHGAPSTSNNLLCIFYKKKKGIFSHNIMITIEKLRYRHCYHLLFRPDSSFTDCSGLFWQCSLEQKDLIYDHTLHYLSCLFSLSSSGSVSSAFPWFSWSWYIARLWAGYVVACSLTWVCLLFLRDYF